MPIPFPRKQRTHLTTPPERAELGRQLVGRQVLFVKLFLLSHDSQIVDNYPYS